MPNSSPDSKKSSEHALEEKEKDRKKKEEEAKAKAQAQAAQGHPTNAQSTTGSGSTPPAMTNDDLDEYAKIQQIVQAAGGAKPLSPALSSPHGPSEPDGPSKSAYETSSGSESSFRSTQ